MILAIFVVVKGGINQMITYCGNPIKMICPDGKESAIIRVWHTGQIKSVILNELEDNNDNLEIQLMFTQLKLEEQNYLKWYKENQ